MPRMFWKPMAVTVGGLAIMDRGGLTYGGLVPERTRYEPHQGEREIARRRRQQNDILLGNTRRGRFLGRWAASL